MSDAMNGSAMLAGNPAGEPAGNAGGTPPASNTNTPPAGGGEPPASGNWYDKIDDAELKGYVQNKGWKDPSELAVGYKNLEKLLGGEKLPMPKGAEDAEGWGRVYDALGRPKSAEEYKLPVPDGQQPTEFTKAASSKFHELGLNQKQAEGLAAWWNEQQTGFANQMNQQNTQKTEADLVALKGEWGQTWDENINLGSRAAKQFGLDQAKLSAIEGAIGTGEMLKLMAQIGRGLGEHSFESGGGSNKFGMTPEAAKERITALRSDSAWATKYMNGGADEQAEMKRLMAIAFPE